MIQKILIFFFIVALCHAEHDPITQTAINKHKVTEELKSKAAELRDGCFPRPGGHGCRCTVKDADGHDREQLYNTEAECNIHATPDPLTNYNKERLNEEFRGRVGHLREGCFPRPKGVGCRCTVRDASGHDREQIFETDAECGVRPAASREPVSITQTAINKHKLNEEFKQMVGNLREGCFPRPGGHGCRCTVKDASGHDREQLFEREEECKVSIRARREARVQQGANNEVSSQQQQRERQKTQAGGAGGVDPVAERARQNYAAVLNELKNKFAGLKEGCYPRPKGCLCVVGKDATGRDITERRLKDSECKCAPGERSRECPTGGA